MGGLGAKEGSPTTYFYTPPSLGPRVLPWAAVLLLLLLKPNRAGKAWWIWLPLAGFVAIEQGLLPLFDFVSSGTKDVFCETFHSLAIGIAAVWLLSSYLQHRLRFLASLKMLVTVAAFGALAFLARQDGDEWAFAFAFLIFVGAGALVMVAALSLAGLVCRGRYLPLRLLLWLFVFILAGWLVISCPFAILAFASGGGGSWLELITIELAVAMITFVTLMPFLILALASGFFRERLKALLHLEHEVPPPIIAPQPAAALAS